MSRIGIDTKCGIDAECFISASHDSAIIIFMLVLLTWAVLFFYPFLII
ncbi:MAG: hypothetical protein ACI8UC_000185 [Psychromonas sp.]|jgi:hypothetical protein